MSLTTLGQVAAEKQLPAQSARAVPALPPVPRSPAARLVNRFAPKLVTKP